jgi:glycosyltransferase involved in cell wall biosynthesis
MTRVSIVQEYIPEYRRPFFNSLRELLRQDDIDLRVHTGRPQGAQALRGDAVSLGWETPLNAREWRVRGKRLSHFPLGTLRESDLVVFEQARRNTAPYRMLARRRRPLVAFWGHGRDLAKAPTGFERFLLEAMTARADWFFGYTDASCAAVMALGLEERRTTSLRNSTDVTALRAALSSGEALRASEELRAKLELRGRTALFIGGFDAPKRLRELVAVGDQISSTDGNFRLLLAGAGELRPWLLEQSSARPWMHVLPPVRGVEKAAILLSADVMAIPGRVGLVALDALTAGLPLVTVASELHPPEFQYLVQGRSVLVSSDMSQFVHDLAGLLKDRATVERMSAGAKQDSFQFGIEHMAAQFHEGVVGVLREGRFNQSR